MGKPVRGPARADTQPVRIVVLGDSLSAGYGLPASSAFPERLEAALKAKGVEFAQEPKKEHWGTSAIFKDPDGNQYVLSSR